MGETVIKPWAVSNTESVMSVARENRWKTFCFSLFFISLVACGSVVDIARSQTQFQNLQKKKNVLILNNFESNMPAFERTNQGLSAVLQSGGIGIRNQFYEHLDLARNPGPENRKLMMQLISRHYSERKIDLIITLFPEGLEFLLDMGQDFFPATPVLALFLPQGFELPETGRRIIPHLVIPDLKRTIEIGLKLVPKAKRVYVVNGTHPLDRWLENIARKDCKKWEDRLDFYYLSDLPMEKILATVSAAPADSIVFITSYSKDVTGKYQTTVELSQELAKVSKAPVFGLLGTVIGNGNVGGSLIRFKHIGTKAGEMALDILRGAQNTENIPVVLKVPQVDIFDWRQLKHWNLSESDLPRGSVIVNRDFSLWDLKYYIIGVLVFILFQSLLIIRLLAQKRRRKSAEETLREKSEELDQFFNVSIELLCISNTDGYFLRVNPAWEKVLGYSREELMAHRFLDFVHPDDIPKTREAVSILLSQGKIVHFGNRYRCKDSTYRWFEWNAVQVGNLTYSVANDRTEYIVAETKARQHRDKLAHITRVATMGELTTSLAHEINQPLTAVGSNAEAARRFLSQAEPDIGEIREILEDIIQDNKRAGDVVQKIRALVRKETFKEEILDLNRMVQELVTLIRSESILKGLTITTELFPELKMIHGDRIQLQQVVLNLILNGAAAMANSPQDKRKIIVKTAIQDSKTVRVSVTDCGTGIDANNTEHIFSAFYTTKPEGLGMGLSISQTIIDAHGGKIKASNNREGGASFVFTLPVGREIRHE
jgi:PAS domain S-box-containing protein